MLNNNSLMDEVMPLEFFLSQNYPNPFKKKTLIKYCAAYKTRVQITVYDSNGNLIEKLVDEEKQAGTYEVIFSASDKPNLPDGDYYYRMEASEYKSEKKILTIHK